MEIECTVLSLIKIIDEWGHEHLKLSRKYVLDQDQLVKLIIFLTYSIYETSNFELNSQPDNLLLFIKMHAKHLVAYVQIN